MDISYAAFENLGEAKAIATLPVGLWEIRASVSWRYVRSRGNYEGSTSYVQWP